MGDVVPDRRGSVRAGTRAAASNSAALLHDGCYGLVGNWVHDRMREVADDGSDTDGNADRDGQLHFVRLNDGFARNVVQLHRELAVGWWQEMLVNILWPHL